MHFEKWGRTCGSARYPGTLHTIMFDSTYEPSKRLLEPIERISEILFGLIMALTFTCTISAASAGQADVRAVLLGALGCNLAWGIVDGAIYLITTLAERARAWRCCAPCSRQPARRTRTASSLPRCRLLLQMRLTPPAWRPSSTG